MILSIFNFGDERIDFVEDRLGHDLRYSIDASKIKRELDFSTSFKFTREIMKFQSWKGQSHG